MNTVEHNGLVRTSNWDSTELADEAIKQVSMWNGQAVNSDACTLRKIYITNDGTIKMLTRSNDRAYLKTEVIDREFAGYLIHTMMGRIFLERWEKDWFGEE